MGAYSMTFESTDYNELSEDELLNSDVEASYEECSMESAMRIAAESTHNWNRILEACAIDELNYLEENGVELIYEGARLDSFIEKAKEFFRNLWEKIQGLFKKALMQFNVWFKNDKDFIKKYEKDLNQARTKDFSDAKDFKFFNYRFYENVEKYIALNDKVKTDLSASDLKGLISEINTISGSTVAPAPTGDDWSTTAKELAKTDVKKKIYNRFRATLMGSNNEVEESDFAKEYKEYLQGGESTRTDVKVTDVLTKCMDFLQKSEKIKTGLNKELNAFKKTIDSAISTLEKIKKDLKEGLGSKETAVAKASGDKFNVATNAITVAKQLKVIQTTATGINLSCLKAASRQAKAVCVKVVNYTPKKESGSLQYESTGSLLDSIIYQ